MQITFRSSYYLVEVWVLTVQGNLWQCLHNLLMKKISPSSVLGLIFILSPTVFLSIRLHTNKYSFLFLVHQCFKITVYTKLQHNWSTPIDWAHPETSFFPGKRALKPLDTCLTCNNSIYYFTILESNLPFPPAIQQYPSIYHSLKCSCNPEYS